jgi:hypothetical protein
MTKINYTVGETVTVRGKDAVIVKVHPFGTVDVQIVASGEFFRVTGLPVYFKA